MWTVSPARRPLARRMVSALLQVDTTLRVEVRSVLSEDSNG